MKTLGALFAVLLAVLSVGFWLSDPGYVLVRLGNFAAETTLWGSLLILTAGALVLRLIYLACRTILWGSSWLLGWTSDRKARGFQAQLEKAALALVQAKWLKAQQHFLKAQKLGDIDLAGNLGLARAAYELGDKEVQISALESAKASSPDSNQSIINLSMIWRIAQGEGAEVIEIIKPIYSAGECSNDMHIVLARAYLSEARRSDLKALWPVLEKQKLLQKVFFEQDFERLWAMRLITEENIADGLKILPKALKSDASILMKWVDLLLLERLLDEAIAVIEVALNAEWDEQLVLLYGTTHGSDIDAQLTQGKKWLKKHPNEFSLLMTLGRLSIVARHMSLGRDYFESALAQAPESDPIRSQIYRELGGVCYGLGDSPRALQYLLKT